jgi:hypothetical protein
MSYRIVHPCPSPVIPACAPYRPRAPSHFTYTRKSLCGWMWSEEVFAFGVLLSSDSLQSVLVGVCVGKISIALWQYLYLDTAPAHFFYLSGRLNHVCQLVIYSR